MIIERKGFDKTQIAQNETLFHVANGYIGIRNSPEEGNCNNSIRGTYINGFYDDIDIVYGEKLYGFPDSKQVLVNNIDCQTIQTTLNGEPLSLVFSNIEDYTQNLNMMEGLASRSYIVKTKKGKKAKVTVTRMASLAFPELFLINYKLDIIDMEGNIAITSTVNGNVKNYAATDDPRVASEEKQYLIPVHTQVNENIQTVACKTTKSNLNCACSVSYDLSDGLISFNSKVPGMCCATFSKNITCGDNIEFTKYCIYTDSRKHKNYLTTGIGLLKAAMQQGASFWYSEQKRKLAAFWSESKIIIQGDNQLQNSIDYSLYCLLASTGENDFTSVAAKGLSGEGYEGHYFWDSETYVLPFLLNTQLKKAKHMLTYRASILPEARSHAKEMGHQKGALFAWRTISGSECSAFFPAGSAQYHINADIARSFMQYWYISEDIDFMAEKGAEVLIETARLWEDAGHMDEDGFKIDCVTGPDEYTCIVNNNFYTNIGAKYNLKGAYDIYQILKEKNKLDILLSKTAVTEEEIENFKLIADSMYLPYDKNLDITAQDDSFLNKKKLDISRIPKENFPLLLHYHPLWLYRHQVCKQADTVFAYCQYPNDVPFDIMKRSFDYYEKVTTHDSSLSMCAFSIMAAYLGDIEKADKYFRTTATLDLNNTHGNTADGIHTANMGGAYLSIVSGFAGLHIDENGLHCAPRIPKSINAYAFKILYKGSTITFFINHEKCIISLQGKANQDIECYDQKKYLSTTSAIEFELQK